MCFLCCSYEREISTAPILSQMGRYESKALHDRHNFLQTAGSSCESISKKYLKASQCKENIHDLVKGLMSGEQLLLD